MAWTVVTRSFHFISIPLSRVYVRYRYSLYFFRYIIINTPPHIRVGNNGKAVLAKIPLIKDRKEKKNCIYTISIKNITQVTEFKYPWKVKFPMAPYFPMSASQAVGNAVMVAAGETGKDCCSSGGGTGLPLVHVVPRAYTQIVQGIIKKRVITAICVTSRYPCKMIQTLSPPPPPPTPLPSQPRLVWSASVNVNANFNRCTRYPLLLGGQRQCEFKACPTG